MIDNKNDFSFDDPVVIVNAIVCVWYFRVIFACII